MPEPDKDESSRASGSLGSCSHPPQWNFRKQISFPTSCFARTYAGVDCLNFDLPAASDHVIHAEARRGMPPIACKAFMIVAHITWATGRLSQ